MCRRIGINRQQFNKYLAGAVRPSRHNMRRICDFFGVTESELLMEPARFAGLVSLRKPAGRGAAPQYLDAVENLHRLSGEMGQYVGWYFRYFYTFGYPGHITRSLAVITEKDGRHLWKNIETGTDPDKAQSRFVGKYEGLAFHLGHRIHIIEYDVLAASSITQLMLYPSYTPRPGHLRGVQTGGSMRRGRKPAASAVVLEFLGERIDIRRALARCGLFEPDEVDDWIKRLIENRIDAGEWVFEIDEI
ncbi:Cro/C1-type HTH DNA-binding domain-containing protein [Roseovarius nanhaiticus]|uniref:Cro/C1-type HTH DNA-binding domain-containing protein n=1 Tax=Roseovarius nanhaiticus TaxID=573024 RepID=A0A1N7HMX0_9RHOB|nr:helix-turn-helix transcriptional regulator [Roseovarius nanhaiticus]SEL37204.1 Cro/C1-type HTH DNA-binding domain-containing protein [Roseovarius nanhaiticus]SIS26172.1 Cro/C1-type HTH DNA-binding domain-containing protein [Roseovarius nanhaiticus]